ncbi:MAG: MMPL family transporter [Formivibrio sp.]|nr:MMPL family transporter [Formivibrio sp.]
MSKTPSTTALHRLAAGLFLLLCLLAAAYLWNQRASLPSRIDSDLFALLPRNERDPLAETAIARLAQQGERQLVILIGHRDASRALQAARDYANRIASLPLKSRALPGDMAGLVDFYRPYRQGLLTAGDREQLTKQTPQAAFEQALGLAISPFSAGGLAWQDDPFGHYSHWLQDLAAGTRVRPQEGMLMVENRGMHYVVLLRELPGSAFSFDLQAQIVPALDTIGTAVRSAIPGSEIYRAGVILHAAAASQTAQREISLIGFGSTVGILLLVLLTWRGWQAPLLVGLSLGTGLLVANGVAFASFARVHALTLVFGASLVGVAVDYALYALIQAVDDDTPPLQRYRRLLPGMLLAMLTTVLGYLGLALTPFPGLMQMAVFSASGIIAAWLAVMLWFPLIGPARMRAGWLARRYLESPRSWQPGQRMLIAAGTLLLALALAGGARFRAHDDIRALAGLNPGLLAEQIAASRILGLPSPAQMFIVTGPDAETVLQREEALGKALDGFVQRGQLSGFDAISRWLPSQARQHADQQLQARLSGPRQQLAAELGLPKEWAELPKSPTLDFAHWQASPLADAARHLWLGQGPDGRVGSMVLLKGLNDPALTPALAALAGPDVRWIDKPAEISQLFGRYRVLLSWVLVVAYVATGLFLYARYRRQWWRALLPPALASVLVIALPGLVGQTLQLLNLVGLLLILGMGVDYGIFLLESPQDRRGILGIVLPACTTLLSFGLLALSTTPALQSFGLTMLLGVTLVLALALVFRPGQQS